MADDRGERGHFVAGHKKLPGAGRRPGSPNKTTVTLKEALLKAATAAGDGSLVAYLTKQALDNPSSFLPLLGRVLPLEVASDPNTTVMITAVTHYVVDSKADVPERPLVINGQERAREGDFSEHDLYEAGTDD